MFLLRMAVISLCFVLPATQAFSEFNPFGGSRHTLSPNNKPPPQKQEQETSTIEEDDSAITPKRRKIRYKRGKKIRVPRYYARPQIMESPLKANITKPKTIGGIHYDDVVKLMQTIEKGNYNEALALAKTIGHPVLETYVLWNGYRLYWLKHPLERLEQFIHHHRSWPDSDRVLMAYEHALSPKDTAAQDVLAWFNRYPPVSNLGHLKRLQALGQANKEKAEILYARKMWREYDLMPQHKDYFMRRYGHKITDDDYLARLERLLKEGDALDVKNKISQMRPKLRRQFYEQWRNQLPPYIIGGLLETLPTSVVKKHPLSEKLQQFHNTDDFDASFDIMQTLPHRINDDNAWWQEYEDYIRFLLYAGYVEEAYLLAKKHRIVWKTGFAEGEWLSGWLALSFLNDAVSAYRHFAHLYKEVSSGLEKGRAAYWTWRSAKTMGNNTIAREWLKKGAQYPTTFYGQLCRAQLSWSYKPLFEQTGAVLLPFHHEALDDNIKALDHDGLLTLLGFFVVTDFVDLGMPFFKHLLFNRAKNSQQRAYIIDMLAHFGHSEHAVYLSRKLSERGYNEPKGAFPMLRDEQIPIEGIEKALVLSVIRQESNFMAVEAVSHAGALGWMQVMPATAEHVSKNLNIPYSKKRLLHDYHYNVQIGTSYLKKLAKDYGGSYPMMLAGYNAGPSRVRLWTKKFGDPKRENVNKIDWIEAIPFYETRHYVLKVLSNLQVYRRLLTDSDKPARDHTLDSFTAPVAP